MHYQELYTSLKKLLKAGGGALPEAGIKLTHHRFKSTGYRVLPGKDTYNCPTHELQFTEAIEPETGYDIDTLKAKDINIQENKDFPYYIVYPLPNTSCKGAILLFHGLNEKNWAKYLPWAAALVEKTQKAVILFPMAFHMDRAPKSWSDINEMNSVAVKRQQLSPTYSNISFINAAVSIRLANQPERLFWSGLQTYLDVVSLVTMLKAGKIENISPNATIDIFGYSLGAFLSLILQMANPKGYFDNSRVFAFCGGATLDRTYPISKYILDSYGGQRLNSYFSDQLYSDFKANCRLAHYMKEHPREQYFKFMLHYNHFKTEREARVAQISDRILAVPLMKDRIAPPVEVLTTLQGDFRNIPTRVEPMDFDYPYDHVHPFSLMERFREQTQSAFQTVMQKAADFLK